MSETWQKTTLGESCKFYNGKAHEQQIDDNGNYIVINSKFISSEGKKFKRTNQVLFPLYQNDIVMVMSDVPNGKAIAKCYLVEQDNKYSLNQRICAIRSDKFYTKFLYYHLSRHPYLLSFDNGENQTNLRRDDILKCPLFVPLLSEQKRIMSIVDEAFEGIDRAIANTEKNLANSRELFESYLNAVFTQKGDGWVENKLGKIAGKVFTGPFGSLLHKSDYISDGIPIVNPTNIEDNKIIPNFNKTISKDVANRMSAYILKHNDVVVGRRGEIGRCAVVRQEQAGWLCGSGSFFIKPFENIDSIFLAHLLRSAPYRSKLEKLASGATMLNLSNQSLSELIIAIPSLDEQNQITSKLDDLSVEINCLETIYKQKLTALKELKQSILQKAFTGELTADTNNQTIKTTEKATS